MRHAIWGLLLLLLIPGCLNYEQHGTIEEDGSGTVDIHYWIKENLFMVMDKGKLAFNEDSVRLQYQAEGVEVLEASTTSDSDDSTRHVHTKLKFDALQDLSNCEGFKGTTFIWQSEGDFFRFEQQMDATMSSSEDLLRDFTFTYAWTFPGDIRSTNADSTDERTAVWIIPLSDFDKDNVLEAKIEASTGRHVDWVLGILLIAVILVFTFRFLRRRADKK
ncbi:hypothetical protein KQI65_12300 [bacterium]|nr:hypothetical protein [bacterium]